MTRFQFPVRNLPLPIQEIATEVEHLVDRMFTKPNCGDACGSGDQAAYAPALDAVENDTHYTVELDLPGVKVEDVKIELHEDKLTISGSRAGRESQDGVVRHREERSFGMFRRTLMLPKQVDTDHVEATYRDGVLSVTIPKIAKAQPRTVEIRTQSN